MPFDVRLDFETNDLIIDSQGDIKIIDAEFLAYQQIHNRLLIARGTYFHDQHLGSDFSRLSSQSNEEYEEYTETAIRDALAGIENINIEGINIERRQVGFVAEDYRPSKLSQLFSNPDMSLGTDDWEHGAANHLFSDSQIYRSQNKSLRCTYTGQPTTADDEDKSNLVNQAIQYSKNKKSTSIIHLWIPSEWDGGSSGPSVAIEEELSTGLSNQADAIAEVIADDVRDQWQQLRIEFDATMGISLRTVLRGWNNESVSSDEPSVGSYLITDDWSTYNGTWSQEPEQSRKQVVANIDFSFDYEFGLLDDNPEFENSVRTTSFVL